MSSKTGKTLTDNDLVRVDAKELLDEMERLGYSTKEKTDTKLRRRRLQNRHSAKLSAARKQGVYDHIAQANERLQAQMKELQERNAELERQALEERVVKDRLLFQADGYRREIGSLSAIVRNLCVPSDESAASSMNTGSTSPHSDGFGEPTTPELFDMAGTGNPDAAECYEDCAMFRWTD